MSKRKRQQVDHSLSTSTTLSPSTDSLTSPTSRPAMKWTLPYYLPYVPQNSSNMKRIPTDFESNITGQYLQSFITMQTENLHILYILSFCLVLCIVIMCLLSILYLVTVRNYNRHLKLLMKVSNNDTKISLPMLSAHKYINSEV